MPKRNPFAALAEHAATLSELWASDPESLQAAIALAENDLDLLKAVVVIAESAPELLKQQSVGPPTTGRAKRKTKRVSVRPPQNRFRNVGTTAAIMTFVSDNPGASLREVVDGIGIDKDKVSATSAMLVKRGRLQKSVNDGLNRYTVAE